VRGVIPPLPNTYSWGGAQLNTGTNLHLILDPGVDISLRAILLLSPHLGLVF